MHPFYLDFQFNCSEKKIAYRDSILFIGSCFSDEMSNLLKRSGINVASNPFGVIYHPNVISRFLRETINNEIEGEHVLQREDVFLSWDANSTLHAYNEKDLIAKLSEIRVTWYEYLKSAQFLFVTFGTAWQYTLNNNERLVANCHKMPSAFFSKSLTETDAIIEEWLPTISLLKRHNPSLEIIFTVSPVRHIRDGLIENNQSKAVLIEAIRRMRNQVNCSYFPAYEIMIDQLRDYRFYKEDRVHPSNEAITFIWDKFCSTYMDSTCASFVKDVDKYYKMREHKALFPKSKSFDLIENKIETLRYELNTKYPGANL